MCRVVFLASLIVVACAAGCHRRSAPAPVAAIGNEPRAPLAATPRANDAAPGDEGFLGMMVAPETVDVTSQLEARVAEIKVRPGDRVARGAIVARLDTRSAGHELAIAAAELAAARTARDEAKLEEAQSDERLSRREGVVELRSGTVRTVSEEELSASRYQEKVAAVKVAAAEANVSSKAAHLAQLRLLVAEGAVRAPFDGTIAARYADLGSLVGKGAPIVRMIESGELRVRFAIPEERANALAVGDPVRIVAGAETLTGVVEKINPEIDAAARMIFAEASLDEPARSSARVRSGQVARVYGSSSAEHASAEHAAADVGDANVRAQ
ncbi:MAG TPA: efflux RND transporter periplasmic adaptor subunit [Polyangia bacterium]|nr:efflux RND transporter periplasmic adaptor subunit [Polyangia bacterium]